MSDQTFRITAATGGERVIDLLAEQTGLPRQRLKDALVKGAVWLKRGGSEQRLRRATRTLLRGDQLVLFYDPDVLARSGPEPTLLSDERDYSVWHKPAGLLAQGTRYGDHCALLRLAEQQLQRPVFLVHRLDREAQGLMLIAHTARAAADLSRLWQGRAVRKLYQVEVEGILGEVGERGAMDAPLDGKPARSEYEITAVDPGRGRSQLLITLITGRKHQIRRHCAGRGAPVAGDYRYGRGGEPLALTAVSLGFRCPLTGVERVYELPPALQPRSARSEG
jgi:tRNA pseudouridine32 synthase/23S rRNA pseudouridine746 synthase